MLNLTELFAILSIPLLICVFNWRLGVLVVLLIGFLQDPLRKLVAGEPLFLSGLVAIAVAFTLLGAGLKGFRPNLRPIYNQIPWMRLPLYFLFLLLGLQFAIGWANSNSLFVPVFGLVSYFAPMPLLLLGYYYSKRPDQVKRFFQFYIIGAALMSAGIYLGNAGYDWRLLKSVGEPLIAFSPSGKLLHLQCGFYRTPEIAAFHSGTSACLLILLLFWRKRIGLSAALYVPLLLFFAGAVFFTGRRKFFVEILLFASIYSLLLVRLARAKLTSIVMIVFAIGICFLLFFTLLPEEFRTDITPYFERNAAVKTDTFERIDSLFHSTWFIIYRHGIWGQGLGVATQGLGGSVLGLRGSTEAGWSKVLAELGIPGIVMIFVCAMCFVVYFVKRLSRLIRNKNDHYAAITAGIICLLIVNSMLFVIAKQAFGDIFILSFLGFLLGFLLGLPEQQKALKPVRKDLPALSAKMPYSTTVFPQRTH